MQPSLIIKRTIDIDGHKTSISLEDAFWTALKEIAQERRKSRGQLIASIDANRTRKSVNLSSAIRVFVLRHYMDQYARQREIFEQREIPVQ